MSTNLTWPTARFRSVRLPPTDEAGATVDDRQNRLIGDGNLWRNRHRRRFPARLRLPTILSRFRRRRLSRTGLRGTSRPRPALFRQRGPLRG